MKRFIFAFLCCFIGLFSVSASTFQDDLNVTLPKNLMWLNNANASSSSVLGGVSILKDNLVWAYYPVDSEVYKLGTYGMTLSFCGEEVAPNNFYALTMYFEYSQTAYYILSQYSQVNFRIGIASSLQAAGQNRSVNPIKYNTAVNSSTYNGVGFQYYSVIFKANDFGTCLSSSFSSNNNLSTNYAGFFGYQFTHLGTDSLTQSQLDSSLNQIQINIDNTIASLKDEQKKTNDKIDKTNDTLTSEDSDITSKKCGVVCKLKGIFTSIVELPKKIVDLLVTGLKNLFVPTDDQLYEIVDSSKELSENFGFVGQSVSFFINIFTDLLGLVNGNGCITLPQFKLGATSLFDEHVFWDSRNVCLADNPVLADNIDTIRSITSIALVSLFIGFASGQLQKILSKNDSEFARDVAGGVVT